MTKTSQRESNYSPPFWEILLDTVTAESPNFTQAATENAYSRVLVGYHFRNSTNEGTAYGRKIGERAATLRLLPVQ
jgi:hypothetical protein